MEAPIVTKNSVLTEVLTLWGIVHIIEVVNLKASLTGHTSEDFTAGLSNSRSPGSCYAQPAILGVSTGCCVGVALSKKKTVRVVI